MKTYDVVVIGADLPGNPAQCGWRSRAVELPSLNGIILAGSAPIGLHSSKSMIESAKVVQMVKESENMAWTLTFIL